MTLAYLVVAFVGGAIAAFALQNLDPVVVRFLIWRAEGVPLAALILGSLVAGMALAGIAGAVQYVKLRLKIRQLEIQLLRVARQPGSGTER